MFKGDLILDPPIEKFVSLMSGLFDDLPYLLSESADQIAGSDPTTWPQYEELDEPSRSAWCSFIFHSILCFKLPFSLCFLVMLD